MLILYRFVLAGVSAVVFSLDQAAEAFAAIAAGEIRRRIEVDWLILHLRQDRCVKTDRLDTSTVRFVARIIGVETAEMLVNENLVPPSSSRQCVGAARHDPTGLAILIISRKTARFLDGSAFGQLTDTGHTQDDNRGCWRPISLLFFVH